MSLITRCPACGTMFKVVADQLKVSQGWVRCGQCSDIFDASAQLMPHDTPWQAATPAPPTSSPASMSSVATVAMAPPPAMSEDSPSDDFDPAGWKQDLLARQQRDTPALYAGDAAADQPPPRPELMRTAAAETADELVSDVTGLAPRVEFANAMAVPTPPAAATVHPSPSSRDLDDADDEQEPRGPDVSFVRDARRQAFWRRPLVQGLMALLAVSLLVVLGLQAAWQQRDSLVAREPRLAAAMQSLCAMLACEIRPARHIESLVIDGSTFTRLGPDAYRLGFVLKNTGPVTLQTPSLELTLTDAQDHAVIRRVLAPSQFGSSAAVMAGQSELTGQLSLRVALQARSGSSLASLPADSSDASSSRIAGYRVIAFYPD